MREPAGNDKKSLWWNQNAKEPIQAKKDALKVLLHNRSSFDLHSRYSETREAVAHAVKLFERTLLGEVWSSIYIQLFIGKQSIFANHLLLAWVKF